MTNPTPDTAAPEAAVEAPEAAQNEPEAVQVVDDSGSNAEAKKWRLKLRDEETKHQETQAERDALTDVLTRTRQAQIDSALAAAKLDPRLLLAAGHSVESLLGEDGMIDAERLAEAVQNTAAEFKVTASHRPAPNPIAGQASGAALKPGSAIWDEAFGGV